MKRVTLCTNIENNDEKIKKLVDGEVSSNQIKYIDNGVLTNIKIFEKKVILTRKNKEYSIKLTFKEKEETKGIYKFTEINNDIELKIYTNKINIEKNNVYIDYYLFDKKIKIGDYKYSIKIEEEI